ncbi:MAG: FtsQ-type POTRA domain-containing protein [Alphaproteobacteria bacterium]|nr:FtsQ-type POTRA domain-containing protein [Alphaproteobacteria bacterium]
MSSARASSRAGPLSRLAGALTAFLNPRRSTVLLTMVLGIVAGATYLVVQGHAQRALAAVSRAADTVGADSGLSIATIRIHGNHNEAPREVYGLLGFGAGDSIFAADPQEARTRLKTLPWIRDVTISRHYPDAVDVQLIERVPFALWQSDHGLYAVERDGRPIAQVKAALFRRAPFFFGDRPDGAAELVTAIRRHHAVAARVKAMQRVSGRRWNLLLDDGVLVKLPEEHWTRELAALERLIVDKGVLERDIAEIDLRSHDNYIFGLRHVTPHKSSRGEPT